MLSKRIRLSLKEKWTGISGMTGVVAEKTSSTSRRNSHHEKVHIHRITRFRRNQRRKNLVNIGQMLSLTWAAST